LHEARVAAGEALIENTHFAGMVLTVSGTALMALSTFYYVRRTAQLNKMRVIKRNVPATGLILSVLIFLIGLIMLYIMSV
jgi:formate/nitrite transporter FocA (FNT family)